MPVINVETILTLVEFAIQEEPKVQAALTSIFSKANPTPADWQALRAQYAAMSYDATVTNSQIPPETPPQAS